MTTAMDFVNGSDGTSGGCTAGGGGAGGGGCGPSEVNMVEPLSFLVATNPIPPGF
jgi:hypothetical protein